MLNLHFLAQKIRAIRSLHLQFLFVALAFTVMVLSSGLYVNNMLRNHLRREAMELLTKTKSKINADMAESSTVLTAISMTIRQMILQGESQEKVLTYMRGIDSELQSKVGGFTFDGLYGHFPVFGDAYLHASGWESLPSYSLADRPWYKMAMEAGDKVAITPIYMSVLLRKSIITFARRISDPEGRTLGVVCLNLPIDRILGYVADMHLTKGGFGVFHNEKRFPCPKAISPSSSTPTFPTSGIPNTRIS